MILLDLVLPPRRHGPATGRTNIVFPSNVGNPLAPASAPLV